MRARITSHSASRRYICGFLAFSFWLLAFSHPSGQTQLYALANLHTVLSLPPISQLSLQRAEAAAKPPEAADIANDELSKLDPTLRLILRREREAQTSFSHFIKVYSAERAFMPSTPKLAELGPFYSLSETKTPRLNSADAIGVLIKFQGSGAAIKRTGARIEAVTGDIMTARVSLEQLKQLAQLPEVVYIEASYRLEPTLDKSVPAVKADLLHRKAPIVEGSDVIIGLVDTGIDYTHPDFRVDADGDGFEESSRILFVWDQTESEPFGDRTAVPFGTEYTKSDIERDLVNGLQNRVVRQRDELGHGTHVAGIAVADGSFNNKFVGMAPKASLIMVKTSFFTGDVIAGVKYIFDKARELKMPAVVNISLGGHFGPHDGTSLFETALENLLNEEGRAIVTSAGNEGNDRIHIGGTLHTDSISFDFIPQQEESVYLSFWYPRDSSFAIEVMTPGEHGPREIIFAGSGGVALQQTRDGSVQIDNASGGPNPNNGDKQIAVTLEKIKKGKRWTITLTDMGGGGRFDGWPGLASMGYFVEGDAQMTISEPGNAKKIITVGAYATKLEWQSLDGQTYRFKDRAFLVGELAPFSSRGPTRDGRPKPDLTAPGTAIASSLASASELAELKELVVSDGKYAVLQGTSMAAPHVAGAVALMFQTDDDLSIEEILEKFIKTADNDSFTRDGPTLAWGAGKLNSAESVDTLGIANPTFGERPAVKVGPNPLSNRAIFFYALPPDTRQAEVIIFNVVGRVVFRAPLDVAQNRLEWDLLNNHGQPLANGLYIFFVSADGIRSRVHRLVVRH